jgi:hypothetical protein
VVIKGSAGMKVGEDVLELSELDAVRVAGDTIRNLEGGPDGAEVIAFGERAGQEQSEMVPAGGATKPERHGRRTLPLHAGRP